MRVRLVGRGRDEFVTSIVGFGDVYMADPQRGEKGNCMGEGLRNDRSQWYEYWRKVRASRCVSAE